MSETTRLYYTDCYLREFQSTVADIAEEGRVVYLEATAFYPTSGGQPHDLGTLNGIAVSDVRDEGGRIAHVLSEPLAAQTVAGTIDWPRRLDWMQQHTGQHLLSAVFVELFGYTTLSVHFGAANTIDVATPQVSAEQLAAAQARANQIVAENRPVAISFADAGEADGLRKAAARSGTLRIVTIEGLDRSACGGTHVSATGEIGVILLRKAEKIRGDTRVEFLCGQRAAARARQDFELLARAAQALSAPPEDVPELTARLAGQLRDSEKARRKLTIELAQRRGRELYADTKPDEQGRRILVLRPEAIDEEVRTLAQSFTTQPGAIFVAAANNSILVAAAPDTGFHAGNRLKEALSAAGGKGGGSAQMAQGSLPGGHAVEALLQSLVVKG